MKHQKVDHTTELKSGDLVFVKGKWAEIFNITEDNGIHTSNGWICRTELMKKPTKRPPSNTESLIRLKDQQYSVHIEHYRVVAYPFETEPKLVHDKTWRQPLKIKGALGDIYTVFVEPRQTGGATTLKVQRDNEQIVVQSVCNSKDHFARRVGVKNCLEKLKKLHNIE